MNFKNWVDYRERCEELNLYTKSHLKELGLKVNNDVLSETHKVYTGGHWKSFEFYKIEDAETIKTRKQQILRDLEVNTENLCKSLYVINKSAKKSRDTKEKNYFMRNHGIVHSAKTRQNNLYFFKNKALEKMIEDELLVLDGYHIQELDDNKTYLLLYRYNTYCFHMIYEDNINNLNDIKFLGEINYKISAESKIENDVKFNEALILLNNYIGGELTYAV
jgi:hypothetical protein